MYFRAITIPYQRKEQNLWLLKENFLLPRVWNYRLRNSLKTDGSYWELRQFKVRTHWAFSNSYDSNAREEFRIFSTWNGSTSERFLIECLMAEIRLVVLEKYEFDYRDWSKLLAFCWIFALLNILIQGTKRTIFQLTIALLQVKGLTLRPWSQKSS